MATGGPSQGYRGASGATRTERILYTAPGGRVIPVEVHRCVNVATHPELGARLRAGEPINVVACPDGRERPVHVSVAYHDPGRRVFVVVVPETARHTELTERSAWLAQLASDAEYELPNYVLRFDVVFGGGELADLLERRDDDRVRSARDAELSQELDKRRARLEEHEARFAASKAEFEKVVAELEVRNEELQARVAELDERASSARDTTTETEIADLSDPDIIPPPDPEGTPLPRPVPHEEIQTNPFELMPEREAAELRARGVSDAELREASDRFVKQRDSGPIVVGSDDDSEVIAADQIVSEEDSEPSIRPRTDDNATTVGGVQTDILTERWIVSREEELKVATAEGVRLAATLTPQQLSGFGEELVVRVQLHRMPTYPIIAITVGDPANKDPYPFLFDVGRESDMGALAALAREFAFELQLFDTEYTPVRRTAITAPLTDNVRYALAAAEQHLTAIPPPQRSFAKASIAYADPEFDRHGRNRPERALFRREILEHVDSPARCRTALDLVAHFSKPEHEELLVLVWGEPLAAWNKARGRTVLKAVELGLWPGSDLARFAVSAGAARSRKDLVQRLHTSFTRTIGSTANDLDDDAIDLNWKALRAEREALGIEAPASNGNGNGAAVVSGTIGGDSDRMPATNPVEAPIAPAADLATLGPQQLVRLLRNKDRRRAAAIELAMRGETLGLGPTFETLKIMTRAEAVQVLGHVTKYGDPATEHLLRGLRSRKGFIRQGCALALGVLKNEEGIEAICDLLLSEPTEIWRELARSVGEVGAGAVMSLLARLKDQGDAGRERAAWALAHVAARGGEAHVETLSHGRDPVAAGVARHALQLVDLARTDDRTVRGADQPREVTVNRAFSRKFFEALDRLAGADAEEDEDDALLLDEADLIEADAEIDDDGEVLDESDLIPT